MKKAIIFDLDDTLYKEIEYLKSAYRDITNWLENTYHISGVYEYMIRSFYAGDNVFDKLNQHYLLNVDINEYLLKYRNHVPVLSLDSNTDLLLNELLNNGCLLGIITDGREISQTNKIKALGLCKYISNDNCIISESFGYAKPSLQNYLYFSEKWGEIDYYYVGDNTSKDFIAPNSLGWKTVCLLDDGRNIHKQNFSESQDKLPGYIINNLIELLHLIN